MDKAIRLDPKSTAGYKNRGISFEHKGNLDKALAYAMQVEALRRLRNGGSQFVRVEHVHVNEGGQAIVGNVTPGIQK